jgi:hypothetical protein
MEDVFYILFVITTIFIWIYLLPLLVLAACVGIPFASTFVVLSFFLSNKYEHNVDSILRRFVCEIPVTRWFGSISNIDIPVDNNYLITSHPHGVFCLGPLLTVHFKRGSRTLFAVAPLIFKIPIFGWFAANVGCIPATKGEIQNALKTTSVILVPGGVPELITQERGQIYTRRYGMFKFDAPMITLITKSNHYSFLKLPFYETRLYIARKLNIPIIFPWVFGHYFTWLPKRTPLVVTLERFSDRETYFANVSSSLRSSP